MKRPLKYQRIYSLIKNTGVLRVMLIQVENTEIRKNGVRPDTRFGQKCGEMLKM